MGGPNESGFVGKVSGIDNKYIYYRPQTVFGVAGGPLLGNSGNVVGLLIGPHNQAGKAIRGDLALRYLKTQGIHLPDPLIER
jgi:hypothetical protein